MTTKNLVIAFDLGTTTLAGTLLDTETGRRLASTGAMNPQRNYGSDVISRLQAAVRCEASFYDMSRIIRDELYRLTLELCTQAGVAVNDVNQIAIAGNPAMQHILLQLPIKTLAFPPYRPLYTEGTHLSARELGWECEASVYIFPMPGGFVGGDTVAFLHAQIHTSTSPNHASLYLDMGTNGEIALVNADKIWATSAAAGPAFEGGNLSCGMVALPGAINSVTLDHEKIKISTIANIHPRGICGSAALQAIDQFLSWGIIDHSGRLKNSSELESNIAHRIVQQNSENAFILYRDAKQLLTLTQNDIRQIQLAKSALRAGIEILFSKSGLQRNCLSATVLTGSFGAFLEPRWLKSLGIFDEAMLQTSSFVSEGALSGVENALCTDDNFASVEILSKKFKVVPLSGTPAFEKLFIDHINFPISTI